MSQYYEKHLGEKVESHRQVKMWAKCDERKIQIQFQMHSIMAYIIAFWVYGFSDFGGGLMQ